jgi:hypothetical protein
MRCALILTLFCSLAGGSLIAQSLRLQGSKIVLPEGNVIGASLSNDLVFIQQAVFHADGPVVHVSRRILAWDIRTNSVVKEKILDMGKSALLGNDCGKVEVIAQRRIVVCENHETLVMLDAVTLAPVSRIYCDGRIYDFSVDDSLKRVFVALRSGSDVQYLTMFDIDTGKQIAQTRISSGPVANGQIVADSRTKRVAVSHSRLEHRGYKTNVYGCSYAGRLTCEYIVTLKQVAQIAMWGRDVFLASGLLADDRHVCLTAINLNTSAVTRQYCAPQTGVHYAVGVIEGKYVIGYTGIARRLAWKEVTKTVNNSVSVWRYENGTVAAAAIQEGADAPFQAGARIACSESTPRFLLYSEMSNVTYVYSIDEASAKEAPEPH